MDHKALENRLQSEIDSVARKYKDLFSAVLGVADTDAGFRSPFSAPPELIGHSGSSSAFLFNVDGTRLYMAGTFNQLEKQGRPFRLMLKVVKIVRAALS